MLQVLIDLKYISYWFSEYCNQFDHPNFSERVETSEKKLHGIKASLEVRGGKSLSDLQTVEIRSIKSEELECRYETDLASISR